VISSAPGYTQRQEESKIKILGLPLVKKIEDKNKEGLQEVKF